MTTTELLVKQVFEECKLDKVKIINLSNNRDMQNYLHYLIFETIKIPCFYNVDFNKVKQIIANKNVKEKNTAIYVEIINNKINNPNPNTNKSLHFFAIWFDDAYVYILNDNKNKHKSLTSFLTINKFDQECNICNNKILCGMGCKICGNDVCNKCFVRIRKCPFCRNPWVRYLKKL